MKAPIFASAILLAINVAADECDPARMPKEVTSQDYFVHECRGQAALQRGDAQSAVVEFEAALDVVLFEAPNYELNVDLADALCRLGRHEEATARLQLFMCMSDFEVGERQCPLDETMPNVSPKECADICINYGSGLSDDGVKALLKARDRARGLFRKCGPNNSLDGARGG